MLKANDFQIQRCESWREMSANMNLVLIPSGVAFDSVGSPSRKKKSRCGCDSSSRQIKSLYDSIEFNIIGTVLSFCRKVFPQNHMNDVSNLTLEEKKGISQLSIRAEKSLQVLHATNTPVNSWLPSSLECVVNASSSTKNQKEGQMEVSSNPASSSKSKSSRIPQEPSKTASKPSVPKRSKRQHIKTMSEQQKQQQPHRRSARKKIEQEVIGDEESLDENDTVSSDESNSFGATGEWENRDQDGEMLTLEMEVHN